MEFGAVIHRPTAVRFAFPLLTLALLVVIVVGVVAERTGYWQLAAFGLGPDLALLAGVGAGLARGQLHPRAVPLYNALHRYGGPLVLLALAAGGVVGTAYLIGALAWCFHVSLDRSVGYGLRTRDGFQRP